MRFSFKFSELDFHFFSQDVRLHCKIVRCQINRLTQFMLSALKVLMVAYRKCFSSKWLRFPHLDSSEIWRFMWVSRFCNKNFILNKFHSMQRPPVSFFVDNLESSSSYRLILFAVNAKGRSEPVIIDDISFKGVAKFTGEFHESLKSWWIFIYEF